MHNETIEKIRSYKTELDQLEGSKQKFYQEKFKQALLDLHRFLETQEERSLKFPIVDQEGTDSGMVATIYLEGREELGMEVTMSIDIGLPDEEGFCVGSTSGYDSSCEDDLLFDSNDKSYHYLIPDVFSSEDGTIDTTNMNPLAQFGIAVLVDAFQKID